MNWFVRYTWDWIRISHMHNKSNISANNEEYLDKVRHFETWIEKNITQIISSTVHRWDENNSLNYDHTMICSRLQIHYQLTRVIAYIRKCLLQTHDPPGSCCSKLQVKSWNTEKSWKIV